MGKPQCYFDCLTLAVQDGPHKQKMQQNDKNHKFF